MRCICLHAVLGRLMARVAAVAAVTAEH